MAADAPQRVALPLLHRQKLKITTRPQLGIRNGITTLASDRTIAYSMTHELLKKQSLLTIEPAVVN